MDVRLSPEQQALRDSAAQVVDRLGPQAVGQLDDRERADEARRRRRRLGLARAAQRRTTAAHRWPSGVEVGDRRRGARPRPRRRAVPRPDARRRAAAPGRRAAGRPTRETVALAAGARRAGRSSPTAARRGRVADRRRAVPTTALVLLPDADGHALGRGRRCGPTASGVDLTRPTGRVDAGARRRRSATRPGCSTPTTSLAGPRSASR